MNPEHIRYRISETSAETLGDLSFVTDIKNERGITSREAFDLVTRHRAVEALRVEAEKIGSVSLSTVPSVFIENFKVFVPAIVSSLLSLTVARQSSMDSWNFLYTPEWVAGGDWFAIYWKDGISGKTLDCRVESGFSCEEALSAFCDEVLFEDRSVSGLHRAFSTEQGEIAFSGLFLAVICSLDFRVQAGGEEKIVSFEKLPGELIPFLGRRPTEEQIHFALSIFSSESEQTEEQAFKFLRSDHILNWDGLLKARTFQVLDSFGAVQGLTLNVPGEDLYERFKNELVERTLWAERRVAMAVLDPVMKGDLNRERVQLIIKEHIDLFRQESRDNNQKLERILEMKTNARKEWEFVSLEKKHEYWRGRVEYQNYASLALLKNQKFLVDLYSN